MISGESFKIILNIVSSVDDPVMGGKNRQKDFGQKFIPFYFEDPI